MSTKSGTYTRTDRRTDGQTDKAKTICPADFSQAGHKKKFQDNLIKGKLGHCPLASLQLLKDKK